MGTLGNKPQYGTYGFTRTQAESFNGDGSTVAFTLGHYVKNTYDIEVLVDNVQQSPFDGSYSVNGTTLTFSGAPSTGTNNIYVVYRQAGTTLDTQTLVPDDGTVTTAKLGTITNMTVDSDLTVGRTITAGSAGNSSANHPALKVYASGTNPEQASIAIQQGTTEGDTIIFGDYDPWIEFGINTDNGADTIDITSGSNSPYLMTTKTLYNNAGDARTAKVIARFNLQSGISDFARIALKDEVGTTGTIWTDANRTGMGDYSGEYVWVDNLHVWNGRYTLDRGWGDYPSITIQNDTGAGPQSEFRIHGIGGVSGGDFSISTRCDGGYITGSDARRKTNIESLTGAIEKVKQLDGKRFNVVNKDLELQTGLSSDPDSKKFGFVAQDVINVIPEAVKYYPEADSAEPNGYASAYAMDYASIVPLLTNAIKEQQQIIEDLQQRLDAAGL